MHRWIWVLIAVSVSTTVYFTIRYGLRPKPIPVMNPTQFEKLEQVGVVVYRRLRQNLRSERILLLGSNPNAPQEQAIWDGLMLAAEADGLQLVRLTPEQAYDPKWARESRAGQLIVVQSETSRVSHLVPESLSHQLEKIYKHPLLSISVLSLAINPEEYDSLQTQCLDAENTGMQRLECAGQRVARKFLKRRLDAERIWAVMERHGLKEYLLFVHRP